MYNQDHFDSLRRYSALGHDSDEHFVLLLASDQSQYNTAVNFEKLCCDWLKYLRNNEITLVRITYSTSLRIEPTLESALNARRTSWLYYVLRSTNLAQNEVI